MRCSKLDGTFDFTAKAIVDGSVDWTQRLTTTLEGMTWRVNGNGLPNHPTGTYPIASSGPCAPNRASPRDPPALEVARSA